MPTARPHAGITLYQREADGPWWFDFRVNGKRIRRSTGERDRGPAEVAALQARAEALTQAGRPARRASEGGGADLAQLAALDLTRAGAKGVTAQQSSSIELSWTHLCRLLGADTDPSEIDFDVVEGFIAARRKEGARGQSIRKEVQALKRGLVIARRRGWLAALPNEWPAVRADPPKKEQAGKLHHPDTLRRWFDALDQTRGGTEARRQAELVLRTGLRAAEIRRLTWSWVEAAPESTGVPAILRIPAEAAKTRNERVVALTAEALALVEAAREGKG